MKQKYAKKLRQSASVSASPKLFHVSNYYRVVLQQSGNGVVKGPILVVDLYELDFYDQNDLKGISIGLAVADAATDAQGNRVDISPEKMEEYLSATGSKIVSYLRERFNEITPNVPVLIAAYELNTDDDDSSKGGYIS